MARRELDGDHPAEAVAHHHGIVDADRGTQRSHVAGELRNRIALCGTVAPAHPAQIERGHGVIPGKVLELGSEGGVVATPAGDEEQLRPAAARSFVVQPQPGELRVRHADVIVSRRSQKIQTTG